MPSTVIRELSVQVVTPINGPDEVSVAMRYDTADPYAVHALFQVTHDYQVAWVFARDLLIAGLGQPSGDGDVRIWPAVAGGREVVYIALHSPDGAALLYAIVDDLVEFLTSTYAMCPRGHEQQHLQTDRALSAFFAS